MRQATKALYGVIRKLRHFNLPIDCQLDLFDKVIQTFLNMGLQTIRIY